MPVVVRRRKRHGDIFERQGHRCRGMHFQLAHNDQRLIAQNARIDHDGALRTGNILVRSIGERHLLERTTIMVKKGGSLFLYDCHQAGHLKDLIRLASTRSSCDDEFFWGELFDITEHGPQCIWLGDSSLVLC